MLLVIDVGNSNTVVGLYRDEKLLVHWRIVTTHYRTSDELRVLLLMLLQQDNINPSEINGCCVSSVVPEFNMPLTEVVRQSFGVVPLMVEPGVKTGIQLHIENPKELGADRLVNAVAAVDEHEGPLIIIDFGTATTFDYVTEHAEYKGGLIVPGIQLSANALFEHCAKLPRVEISTPKSIIGRNTVDHIRAGLTFGSADMVDGTIKRIMDETGVSCTVVATGGLAPVIAETARLIDIVDPLLTMKGLRGIYTRNTQDAS